MSRPLAIFDLDGTLVETAGDLVFTLNHLLDAEGLPPVTLAAARDMVGDGAKALIARGFAANGTELADDRLERLFADFLVHYGANIANESHAFPGAEAALDRLQEAGFALAVCTNKPESMSKLLLSELGLADRFAVIAGPETFDVRKPDPRHISETIAAAGAAPEATIVIGDSMNDVAAAKGAGVPVIVVDFGYTTIPVPELGADRIISHFDDLFDEITSLAPHLFGHGEPRSTA